MRAFYPHHHQCSKQLYFQMAIIQKTCRLFFFSCDYGRRSILHKWSLLTQDNMKNQHVLVAVSLAASHSKNSKRCSGSAGASPLIE
uniref:Uncharacterized protein n=1 Tax=Glossina palpalis gambiensis TaxID=67801 RepID=A0A1B0AWU6_9MUSC